MPQLEQGSGRSGRRRGLLRRSVRIAGELLITAGVILLLFVAWQLWWTNVASDARQRDVVKDFARGMGAASPAAPEPPGTGGTA